MKLFEYVIIHNDEENDKTTLLTEGIQTIMADDDKTASMKIAREIPEEYVDRLSEVEVVIRPF